MLSLRKFSVDRLTSMTERLLNSSTCDISDALLKLNHHRGGLVSGVSMWSPKRQEGPTKIIGPAYTVKFVMNQETGAPRLSQHHIDTVPSGSVIFLSVPRGVQNAAYGGLMTHRARFQGAAGTVIDGNLRDLQEHRSLEYPVFARGVATPPYSEVVRPSEVNVPVKAHDNDVIVDSGDIIVADLNGVVCIPKNLLDQVADLLPGLAEADAKVEADLKRGVSFAEASKKHRK